MCAATAKHPQLLDHAGLLSLFYGWRLGSILLMTDKQEVIDALSTMPESASLEEIIEELRIIAAVRRGRADIAAGRFKTQEEVKRLVDSWLPHNPSQP
jgi:predicted transcriptional regulator